MKEKFYQKNAITLVALVITIIVLLILAGVSISLVVGDNGVLTQADKSVAKTDKSNAREALQRALVGLQAQFTDNWDPAEDDASFIEYLNNTVIGTEASDATDKITEDGYTISVSTGTSAESKITISGSIWKGKVTDKDKNPNYGFTIEGNTTDFLNTTLGGALMTD